MLVCIWLLVVDGGDDTIDLIIFTWVAAVVIRVPKWHGRRGTVVVGRTAGVDIF
jgi:hypothetical protein